MVGNEKDIDALLERERRCLCARSGRDLLCERACTVWAKPNTHAHVQYGSGYMQ
jgi:hypothetical protein